LNVLFTPLWGLLKYCSAEHLIAVLRTPCFSPPAVLLTGARRLYEAGEELARPFEGRFSYFSWTRPSSGKEHFSYPCNSFHLPLLFVLNPKFLYNTEGNSPLGEFSWVTAVSLAWSNCCILIFQYTPQCFVVH
jgi:hypothetical protein